jgi:hypothetical protein
MVPGKSSIANARTGAGGKPLLQSEENRFFARIG